MKALICLLAAAALVACNDTEPKEKVNNTTTSANATTNGVPNAEPNQVPNGAPNVAPNGAPNIAPNGNPNAVTPSTNKVDLLVVADNSGSMCQEQKALRERFGAFVDVLVENDIDFHIGITTTHVADDYRPEPLAMAGHLQSTPQPVPGFDLSCQFALDASGEPIRGDYSPVRELAQFAATCAGEDPANYAWTDAELECFFTGRPDCPVCEGGACSPADAFPSPSDYLDFPKVFRAEDYTSTDGVFDREKFLFDFGCASLVGTRGYGIEKGLEAAVLATSPFLTGGAVGTDGADTSAPNHGLFREDSRFGLFFLTDEDDCSNNGELDETTACGGDVCAYANAESVPDGESPLIAVEALREELLANLSSTTGREVTPSEVAVVSLHGPPTRVAEPVSADECLLPEYEPIGPECANANFGSIGSSDRHARFAAGFPATYPPAEGDVVPESLCAGLLDDLLVGAATFLAQP